MIDAFMEPVIYFWSIYHYVTDARYKAKSSFYIQEVARTVVCSQTTHTLHTLSKHLFKKKKENLI